MTLPDFVIVGAVKAGSSALHACLAGHADIYMSEPKELNFFQLNRNWRRGVGWYEARFDGPTARRAQLRGEASPQYTRGWRYPGIAERMSSVIPDAKLVYVVRDPVDRAVSEFRHRWSKGKEHRPIDEALLDSTIYDECSVYWTQLAPFLAAFPPERVGVFVSERLFRSDAVELTRLAEFLDIDPEPIVSKPFPLANASDKRAVRPSGVRHASRLTTYKRISAWTPPSVKRVWRRATSRPLSDFDFNAHPSPATRFRVASRLTSEVAALSRYLADPLEDWTTYLAAIREGAAGASAVEDV